MHRRPFMHSAVCGTLAFLTVVGIFTPRVAPDLYNAPGGYSVRVACALLTLLVIWYFWQCMRWARWLVIAGCMLTVLVAPLYALTELIFRRSPDLIGCVVVAFEFVLAAFLLFWLNSERVRVYFTGEGKAAGG